MTTCSDIPGHAATVEISLYHAIGGRHALVAAVDDSGTLLSLPSTTSTGGCSLTRCLPRSSRAASVNGTGVTW
ncbi:MAG TPA: hypothetical protein VN840_10180 [Streptosporangiaceae bacterium]|nr:hypothetical protein [Streptosporangiaceae bacterium]